MDAQFVDLGFDNACIKGTIADTILQCLLDSDDVIVVHLRFQCQECWIQRSKADPSNLTIANWITDPKPVRLKGRKFAEGLGHWMNGMSWIKISLTQQ